jgi:branched-chain amino acid transport system ATP-binding protein
VLGSNGAGKTTLFNCVTGDFLPSSGTIRLFGEDVTEFPAHERIRRGLRRTYQISLLFGGLSVADNVDPACRGVSRNRFSLLRPRRGDPLPDAQRRIDRSVHLAEVRQKLVSELSYGQQRQLEIALALAGAPRLILFDEPAAGLSPTERAELIAILTNMPPHIGFIIIEHDMDVALRVAQRVTMMHNGRVFKEGTPAEIEEDPQVQGSILGMAAMRMPEKAGPAALEIRGLNVFLDGASHALQGVDLRLDTGALFVVGQWHGGKTTLCKAIMGLVPVASGSISFHGQPLVGRQPISRAPALAMCRRADGSGVP